MARFLGSIKCSLFGYIIVAYYLFTAMFNVAVIKGTQLWLT